MTPEGKIKDEIKAWLKEQGAYFFMPVQMGIGASTLDILVCLNGRFIGIEVKAWGEHLTSRQGVVVNQIRNAGGLAFMAKSLDDVKAALAPLEQKAF